MRRLTAFSSRLLTVAPLLLACACASQPKPAASTAPPAAALSWDGFVDSFIEGYFKLNPDDAAGQGRHEFDGLLPDWSPEGLKKQLAWWDEQHAKLSSFDVAKLPEPQRFQHAYVRSNIDAQLFQLRDLRAPAKNPVFYRGSLDGSTYVTRPYAPVEKRAQAFISHLEKVPTAVAQLRANLELPLPRTFVDFAAISFKGMAEFYRGDALLALAEAKDFDLQSRLRAAIEPAAQAMLDLGGWFAAQTTFDEQGFVLGAERFRGLLASSEGVTTPLDELEAIGKADLARNTEALTAACALYLPKASIQKCMEKLNTDKPTGGAVEGARNQLGALRDFIQKHDIVSIPGTEGIKVDEAPAYSRIGGAYIDIPGPYEKNMPSIYYISPPDPRWTQEEQDAYVPGKADLLFTSVHEVWPGHFLQFLHSNRGAWRFGQLFVGYSYAEGWAHYAEELMIEQGIAEGAPELHIGQLSNALLRNVRFLCAIGLHTQGMSVAACEQMFKEKAYQDAGNARQQASRGTWDPGYLNYTMGKLMIRKLRADWQKENPGKSLREFHDAFLAHGGPPIPLLRTVLLKEPAGSLF